MKKKLTVFPNSSNSSKAKSLSLDEISKKLNSSSALNGGFDTLLYKIDKIEQSQGQLVNKVDKIHDAIYDPNEGIFSKLNDYKLENTNKLNNMSQNITELQLWKDVRSKEDEKLEKTDDEAKEKLGEMEKSVENLVRSRNNAWAVTKWFLVAIGGAIVTIFMEWIQNRFHFTLSN